MRAVSVARWCLEYGYISTEEFWAITQQVKDAVDKGAFSSWVEYGISFSFGRGVWQGLKVEMVSKADKNEVTSYFLTIPGNKITEQGVSLSIGDKEVASYDEFAFMLFKESDVSNLIGKLSDLFDKQRCRHRCCQQ